MTRCTGCSAPTGTDWTVWYDLLTASRLSV
jgi:hypothetical protein